MNNIFLSTPQSERNELPHKIMPDGGTNGDIKILKPADPEKLAKLHRHKRSIGDKRVAGGLDREKKGYGRG